MSRFKKYIEEKYESSVVLTLHKDRKGYTLETEDEILLENVDSDTIFNALVDYIDLNPNKILKSVGKLGKVNFRADNGVVEYIKKEYAPHQ